MDNYNPNIHHRKSIRLKGYDYAKPGLYFITICVNDKQYLFGIIENGKVALNDAGKIAEKCWMDIPAHFPNAKLHKHIVMPNHIHGIIELIENGGNFQPQRNEFQKMIPHSICSIVKGFKIGVTKWFREKKDSRIIWQRDYYESIIRDKKSYERITKYITNNPHNWLKDDFNKD
jgi:putative transposase